MAEPFSDRFVTNEDEVDIVPPKKSRKATEWNEEDAHAFADVEAERAQQDREEAAFTRKATEHLTRMQEGFEKALKPLVQQTLDAPKIGQGRPLDRFTDVKVPGVRQYTDFVKGFLWDTFNIGRRELAQATGQKADGPISNRMRRWVESKAEVIAEAHAGMIKTSVINRVLTGIRAEMSAEQIFSDAGAEAIERLNRDTARDWSAAAAEVLALMSEG